MNSSSAASASPGDPVAPDTALAPDSTVTADDARASDAARASDTARLFERIFGAEPTGVWAAPGRVNLIGEHTDYNDGFVMPLALPHTTTVAAAPRGDGVLALYSADLPGPVAVLPLEDLTPGAVPGWTGYPAGVLWALRDAGHEVGGASLCVTSTVPTGAGLSSSAALEVASAMALCELYGAVPDGQRLARIAQRAENAFVGVPCGIMDQMASACCTAGHLLHLDTRDMAARQVPFDMAVEGLRLLVVDTRVKHDLADGGYAERRAGCEAGAEALGVPSLRSIPHDGLDDALAPLGDPVVRALVRHVVTENERVARVVELLEAGRARELGPVLSEGHASLRDDFRVSCPELDLVVGTAVAAGALGARMTGGGFGGSAVVLVEADAVGELGERVVAASAAAGHPQPRVFEAVPSAGARRIL
ncbi:galactokinase [Streptomyces alkaliphilus]|uniref:Galactokinase n=1 Tax=Streptomyces alkaliphilus TaxID=1472722 RepID=A0A7W3Y267_9ACTN|nr:galactokinase [Streptomyces alkaliphilus]MBB0245020.1 galactokinase [Streptomyces alkaliphilus]